jgi:tetratricopeptide (TPR) repeat protein
MKPLNMIINLCLILFLFIQTGCKTTSSELTQRALNARFAGMVSSEGIIAIKNHEYNRAIQIFTRAIKIYPEDANHWSNRGVVYLLLGEYQMALSDLNRAIEISNTINSDKQKMRDLAGYFKNRGIINERIGEYDKAILDYDRSIEITPSDSGLYSNRALVYHKKSKYVESIDDYNKALEINNKNSSANNGLSWILATCKDDKYRDGSKAILLAKKALKKDSKKYLYIATLAAAYAETGNFEEAIHTQEKAIALLKKSNEAGINNLINYEERLSSYKAGMPWRDDLLKNKDGEENIINIVYK